MICSYAGVCSGCGLIQTPSDKQKEIQKAPLKPLLDLFRAETGKEASWISIADFGLRDRADLIFESVGEVSSLGLYRIDKKEILDLEACPQMSPELLKYYEKVRRVQFPIRKGSLRIRVGPLGHKGIWLDFANEDIKNLLDKKDVLVELQSFSDVIELGQKRKTWQPEGRLAGPQPLPWFQTVSGEKDFLLHSFVGSFTQPSLRANRVLVQKTMELIKKAEARSVFEFGSGIGNFTLPMADQGIRVLALEIDAQAVDLLTLNMQKNLSQEAQDLVEVRQGNFHKEGLVSFSGCDALLLDPPRSGVGDFLSSIKGDTNQSLRSVVYVSCFPESLLKDSQILLQAGFSLQELSFVNQFPQTSHVEVVTLWRR